MLLTSQGVKAFGPPKRYWPTHSTPPPLSTPPPPSPFPRACSTHATNHARNPHRFTQSDTAHATHFTHANSTRAAPHARNTSCTQHFTHANSTHATLHARNTWRTQHLTHATSLFAQQFTHATNFTHVTSCPCPETLLSLSENRPQPLQRRVNGRVGGSCPLVLLQSFLVRNRIHFASFAICDPTSCRKKPGRKTHQTRKLMFFWQLPVAQQITVKLSGHPKGNASPKPLYAPLGQHRLTHRLHGKV